MRYRYRIDPTPAQRSMLARVFGCARVVFNDALRVRAEAYRVGVKLSDSEIQRRVITAAKTTPARAWLCEVPSVALVQSVNHSPRAWRNFFDSTSGKRKGRKVGRPRFKSRKDHRQSFRLTRNGFSAVSRWLASSKTCSTCGHRLDELAMQVRQWTCPACRAFHDRDHNAAKVILAAGRAERRNAGGAQVSPPTTREARGDETGSTPTAA